MSQNQNPPSEALSLWGAFDAWCRESWRRPENWVDCVPPKWSPNTETETKLFKGRSYFTDIDGANIMSPLDELADLAIKGEIIWWGRPLSEIAPYQAMPVAALSNFRLPSLSERIIDVLQHIYVGDTVWHPRFAEKPREGNAHRARRNAEAYLTSLLDVHEGNYLPWTVDDGYELLLKAYPKECAGLTRAGYKDALESAKKRDGRNWKVGRRPSSLDKNR